MRSDIIENLGKIYLSESTKGKVPTAQWVSKTYGIPFEDALQHIRTFQSSLPGIPVIKEEIKTVEYTLDPTKKKSFDFHSISIFGLQIICGVLAILSSIRSGGYVHDFFAVDGDGIFPWIMGILGPGSITIIPQIISFLPKYIGLERLKKILWWLFFCIVFVTVTMTSISGIYYSRSKAQEQVAGNLLESNRSNAAGDILRAEEAGLVIDQKTSQDKISDFESRKKPLATGSREFNILDWQERQEQGNLSEIKKSLESNRAKQIPLTSVVVYQGEKRLGVFDFLAKSWGGTKEIWEAFFTVVPAVTFEMWGPIFAWAALFLGRKREEIETSKK